MFKVNKLFIVFMVVTLLVIGSSSLVMGAEEETEKYAMVVFLRGSEFFNWAYGGMEDAAELLGDNIEVELRGPSDWDAMEEARAIEQLISRDIDGIIVTAGEADPLVPAINKAIEAGIPVVTFDSDAPRSKRLSFVGTNNYEAGKLAGEAIVDWLDGEGQVGISSYPGPDHLKEREDGFRDALEGSNVEVVEKVNDEGEIDVAETQITAMLQSNPDIDVIFCAHGNPGAGAAAAVKNLGMEDEVEIMGFDFGKPVVERIETGTIKATVGQNPYLMGYIGMQMLWNANRDTGVKSRMDSFGHVAPAIDTGVSILYEEDVDQYLDPPDFVKGD